MIVKTFEKFKNLKKVYKDLDKDKIGIDKITSGVSKSDPLKKLKKIVKHISKSFGYGSEVRYLDSGSCGMAFIIKDKVIKLTSNEEEFLIAKQLLGQNIPHMVRYYKVKRIIEYGIWAILMDKARNLDKDESIAMRLIDDYGYIDLGWTCENVKDLMEDSFSDIEKYAKKEKISIILVKRIWEDYKNMIYNLLKNSISIKDLHPGNIGYIGKDMVHFDVMGQTSSEEIFKISDY